MHGQVILKNIFSVLNILLILYLMLGERKSRRYNAVPSDAECIFEHIFYKAMVQILEYYLQQPIEIVREKLGMYIDYIQKENLKFSEFGEKIAQRLSNEK